MHRLHAGIETGGTKILARLVDAAGTTIADGRWPTTTPEEALAQLAAFFSGAVPATARLEGIGMAAFGPLVVDPGAPAYGRMLATPKPGWSGSNLRAQLEQLLRVPVRVDTDVNAAALAEQHHGAGHGLDSVAYLTVGTGLGGGLALRGNTLHGIAHPEIGHIALRRAADDRQPSACPFHTDCAEGLAAGPAIAQRLGAGGVLADAPPVQVLIAHYLGQLAASLVLAWAPQRIVWGGGVMATTGLIEQVHAALLETLGGYGTDAVRATDYCLPAALEHAGLEGALLMARSM